MRDKGENRTDERRKMKNERGKRETGKAHRRLRAASKWKSVNHETSGM